MFITNYLSTITKKPYPDRHLAATLLLLFASTSPDKASHLYTSLDLRHVLRQNFQKDLGHRKLVILWELFNLAPIAPTRVILVVKLNV